MAKFISFVALFVSLSAQAQLFQNPFGRGDEKKDASGNALEKNLEELEGLDMGGSFEERYRIVSMEIERQLDLKRGDCTENPDKGEKQRCFREVLSAHKRYLEKGFALKKDYLKRLHERQISALNEARVKALKELEQPF